MMSPPLDAIAGELRETVEDAVDATRRKAKGWRGTEPATLKAIEQVQIAGAPGVRPMIVLTTPEGDRAFVLTVEDGAALGGELARICGPAAKVGLFVVGG